MYTFLCGHKFSFILDRPRSGIVESYMFKGIARLISKATAPFHIPTSNKWGLRFLHISSITGYYVFLIVVILVLLVSSCSIKKLCSALHPTCHLLCLFCPFSFHQPHRVLFLASKIVNVAEFDRWLGADSGGGSREASLNNTQNNLWATVSFFRAPQHCRCEDFLTSPVLVPSSPSLPFILALTHTLGFKIVLITPNNLAPQSPPHLHQPCLGTIWPQLRYPICWC